MDIQLKKYVLELKHTFSISRESYDFQDSLIVCLSLDGKTGYGEATSNPYYQITTEKMISEINDIADELKNYTFTSPEDLYSWLTLKNISNFSKCAIDLAAHDLYGKLLNQPLYKIWNTDIGHYPVTSYTIGIASVEKMIEKLEAFPWPIYKIKLGTDRDIEIIRRLRAHSNAIFRVDANCAWAPGETVKNSFILKELGVEFIEQPLKADNWESYKTVYKESALPVIADESCIIASDVEKCLGYFNGINIKLTKCGGLTPALQMIKTAKKSGLKTMVGCMTESTVGISAIAQLLPQLDYVDMDGAMLLKKDIAQGVRIEAKGKVIFPELGGSGITLN